MKGGALIGDWKHHNLTLIFSSGHNGLFPKKPVEHLGQSILSVRSGTQGKGVTGTHFEERLREDPGTDVVGLVGKDDAN
jgi:hypothetical protein